MLETTITRSNALVDPALHVWAWEIPLYLFLGGLVAGLMIITGLALLRGHASRTRSIVHQAPWLSLALLTAGMLFLFLDLEHKPYVWRLYTTFQPWSPMSWGSWILLLVYPALVASAFVGPPDLVAALVPPVDRASAWLEARPSWVKAIAWANVALGTGLGIYTGILLSALGARPFWNSAVLGPLFLISGLSSAAAWGHMTSPDAEERRLLAWLDNHFLTAELVVLGLFVVGLASGASASREAAALVLGGPFTAVFWVGVVGLGILVPLCIQSLAVTHRVQHTAVAPLLVLAGGLVLRIVFVEAGQYSRWTSAAASTLGLQ
ncbi:MAG: polysulfide reductase NrfD [Vicinamibacterales bacterium]|nr:polysulfide reductase NrfD [Vicinamibacterales bacterium]